MKKLNTIILFITLNLSLYTFHSYSQWYQQSLPGNYGGIYCLKFWNVNTGWVSTGAFDSIYNCKILKTTNGGDNWFIIKDSTRMYEFQVIDSITIYGRVRNVHANESIYRTFNGGLTWDSVSHTGDYVYAGLYFFNKDTGYVGMSDGSWGYMMKTTNGGATLTQIYRDDNKYFGFGIKFFKDKVNGEYCGYCTAYGAGLYKTTNSGINWCFFTNNLFNYSLGGYYFLNTDTGWVSGAGEHFTIQHTTNGGLNWVDQYTSLFYTNHPTDIYFYSYTKGWAGSDYGYKLYATTDGGQTWGRQNVPILRPLSLCFLDTNYGWSYGTGISHTTNGGGMIIGIHKNLTINKIPEHYTLMQNYPNPFNSSTIIEYSIVDKAAIGINIYDITGKSVYDMAANNQEPGNYKLSLDFGSLGLSSGIYFYRFLAVDAAGKKLLSQTKRMMFTK